MGLCAKVRSIWNVDISKVAIGLHGIAKITNIELSYRLSKQSEICKIVKKRKSGYIGHVKHYHQPVIFRGGIYGTRCRGRRHVKHEWRCICSQSLVGFQTWRCRCTRPRRTSEYRFTTCCQYHACRLTWRQHLLVTTRRRRRKQSERKRRSSSAL